MTIFDEHGTGDFERASVHGRTLQSLIRMRLLIDGECGWRIGSAGLARLASLYRERALAAEKELSRLSLEALLAELDSELPEAA
jgi:hypothetical protein